MPVSDDMNKRKLMCMCTKKKGEFVFRLTIDEIGYIGQPIYGVEKLKVSVVMQLDAIDQPICM